MESYTRPATPSNHAASTSGKKKSMLIVASLLVVAAAVATAIGAAVSSSGGDKTSVQSSSLRSSATSKNFMDFDISRKKNTKTGNNEDSSTFSVPSSSLNKPFLVHALVDKSTVSEGKVITKTRGYFAKDNDHIVFHFELSENKKDIYVVREDYLTRTSDKQMKYSKDRSVWPGYVATIPLLNKASTFHVFSVRKLVESGFFVSKTFVGKDYTIIEGESSSHKHNTNLQIQYMHSKTHVATSMFYSITELPADIMPSRAADNRVGYFSGRYTDLGTQERTTARESNDVDRSVSIIYRQRLENDEAGKVKKQILYYIDPSVPQRWRKAFKEGVEIWGPAFEKAGFKNAIRAILPDDKDWPADYHIGDLRYNTISFSIAKRVSAIGPSVVDPRSGEIIHTDIVFGNGWIKSWIRGFDRSAPTKPSTLKNVDNEASFQCNVADTLESEYDANVVEAFVADTHGRVPKHIIDAALRDVIMHEVGHTLGLRHNFYGTIERTPEQLYDDEFVRKHGPSSSVMDYFGVNIWSNIVKKDANKVQYYQEVLGEYDVAALVYGYKYIEGEVSTYKNAELERLAASTPILLTDEDASEDLNAQNPYAMKHDYSSRPIFYYMDQIKLQNILRNKIVERSIHDGESWSKVWSMESYYIRRLNSYLPKASVFIGGMNVTHAHYSSHKEKFDVPAVSRSEQLEAVEFMAKVISGDDCFPSPEKFSQYVEDVGYDCEDAVSSYCLSTKVANVDGLIQKVRINAIAALIAEANLKKIVIQGQKAEVTVSEILKASVVASFKKSVYSHDANIQSSVISKLGKLRKHQDNRIAGPATSAIKFAISLIKAEMKKLDGKDAMKLAELQNVEKLAKAALK